ncbi:hypothetical protein K437DRAFT_292855 [Tilletiaria anomala UBC 951]|uniref:DUF410-domain-containing protein n=1 Tax=Tilletiaria anomala (strain ATCC 24038 / CBS 436.72 / UBC 951) TaxID=1037660 RepID=A0A066WFJ5_TILAU|nr:uncharacterized protein K437DRAFT_292855 [Tilletiaria anomala UBC 951]KDN52747.1 hypothetical protein K437DRAFT_292855 [Tilletiaria anomala UBC 951]
MSGYDEHQRLRTKAVRLLSKKNYPAAIALLYEGSMKMLQAGEQGSGCDLAIYMIDVYGQAGVELDKTSRDRIFQILKLAKADFWRKKLTDAAVKWSTKASGADGDPALRYEVAKLLWKEGSYLQAEPHFHASIPAPSDDNVASDSTELQEAPANLGSMMVDWLEVHATKSVELRSHGKSGEDKDGPDAAAIQRIEAGRFALRGLFLLLIAGKVPAAHSYLKSFISKLVAHPACKTLPLPMEPNPRTFSPPAGVNAPPARQITPSGEQSDYVQPLWLTANADINFAQMCLGLVDCAWRVKGEAKGLSQSERGAARAPDALRNAWIALARQYVKQGVAGSVDDVVGEGINTLSGLFFDLQPPRAQGNMLADMMSSLFGGSSSSPAAAAPKGAKWVTYKRYSEPVILTEEEDEERTEAETDSLAQPKGQSQAQGSKGATASGGASAPVAPPVEEDLD